MRCPRCHGTQLLRKKADPRMQGIALCLACGRYVIPEDPRAVALVNWRRLAQGLLSRGRRRLLFAPQGGWVLWDHGHQFIYGAYTDGMSACEPLGLYCPTTRRGAFIHLDSVKRLVNISKIFSKITGGSTNRSVWVLTEDLQLLDVIRKYAKEGWLLIGQKCERTYGEAYLTTDPVRWLDEKPIGFTLDNYQQQDWHVVGSDGNTLRPFVTSQSASYIACINGQYRTQTQIRQQLTSTVSTSVIETGSDSKKGSNSSSNETKIATTSTTTTTTTSSSSSTSTRVTSFSSSNYVSTSSSTYVPSSSSFRTLSLVQSDPKESQLSSKRDFKTPERVRFNLPSCRHSGCNCTTFFPVQDNKLLCANCNHSEHF